MPLCDVNDAAPGMLCCLNTRPAGEESRDECGEAAVDGDRDVDSECVPLLNVPVLLGTCTPRGCVCSNGGVCGCCCAGSRSFGHFAEEEVVLLEVTLFVVFGSMLFAGSAVRVVASPALTVLCFCSASTPSGEESGLV
jgi:hypothetical protein